MNDTWIRLDDGSDDESRASSPLCSSFTSSHGFLENSGPESNGSMSDMEGDMESTLLAGVQSKCLTDCMCVIHRCRNAFLVGGYCKAVQCMGFIPGTTY